MAVCIIAASTTEYPCLFRIGGMIMPLIISSTLTLVILAGSILLIILIPMYIVARARVVVDPGDGGGLKPP